MKQFERYITIILLGCILFIVGGIFYTLFIYEGVQIMVPEDSNPILNSFLKIEFYLLVISLTFGLLFVLIQKKVLYIDSIQRKNILIIVIICNAAFILFMFLYNGYPNFNYQYINYFGFFKVYYSEYSFDLQIRLLLALVFSLYFATTLIVLFNYKKNKKT